MTDPFRRDLYRVDCNRCGDRFLERTGYSTRASVSDAGGWSFCSMACVKSFLEFEGGVPIQGKHTFEEVEWTITPELAQERLV